MGWQFYGECVGIGSPFGRVSGNVNQSGKWLGPDSVLATTLPYLDICRLQAVTSHSFGPALIFSINSIAWPD